MRLKRLLVKLVPYWPMAVGAAFSALVVLVLNLLIPQFIRLVIDEAILEGQVFLLPWIAGGIVLVTVVKGVFSFGQRYLMERVAQKIIFDLRNRLYNHLQHLSFSYYENTQTGQLMSRATADVEMLKRFYGFGIIHLFQGAVTFIGVLIVIFAMHARLAALTVLALPIILVVIFRFGKKVGPAYQVIQEQLADLTSVLQENLTGIRVVKAFGREEGESQKFDNENAALLNKNISAVRIWAYYFPFLSFLTGLAAAFIIWYGGREVIAGRLMLGELIAFNSYLLMLVMPMRMLGWVVNLSQRALTSAARVFEILDTKPEIDDAPDARELLDVKGEVTFRSVSFAYREGVEALKNISFTAKPGENVAIVGTTGSGKTTLVSLIPRFYDPTEGEVLLDHEDIRSFTLQSLRRTIGFVSQDTFLFSATISENIGYGDAKADHEAIVAAAKAAQIHDFIVTLPQGYETMVGERGVNLSGGQKQRIAIARALLKDPKILILDDYTSSVDAHTEYLIRGALDTLMAGRTSFIIAQRISTVLAADQILVMDGGEIVARGTHEDLLETSPLYQEIYNIQFSGNSLTCDEEGRDNPWTT
ncbi:ABC transporter ATP-binding protein [Dethiobacter alkaliphilus]|uniref:ABC transporter related protein n=1 Tax=Dethiobacter alkaliphilus AHT 1 TaxID=555088 RepID=C0GHP4_DETAL|nr:ABC transporter ATP-binding protein [Dethiobacter alkaliphilus]EEG77250.1 ABC transporter related protein [Dethiobacter alkaliphilus AHT 1]